MKKIWLRILSVALLAVMTAVFLTGTVRSIAGAAAGEEAGAKISVTGKGAVSEKPDTVYFSYGVNTFDLSPSRAARLNAAITDRINNALISADISTEDVQTVSYNIYPEYNYYEGRSTLKGYNVQNYSRLKSGGVEDAGRLLDLLTAAGANYIGGIEFECSDSGVYELALTAAVNDARHKAEIIAGGKPVRLISVSEGGERYGDGKLYSVRAEASASTPIAAGRCTVCAYVTAEFEIV